MRRAEEEVWRPGDPDPSGAGATGSATFPSTSWSVVRAAGGTDPDRARTALLQLADRYRGPARAYLLQDGYSESEADSLATRFFAELGGAASLRSAAEGTEPFRVWLLRELEKFLSTDPDPTAQSDSNPAEPVPLSEATRLPAVPGYQTLEVLGVGAEGTVYRAYDIQAQRHVALKLLRREYLREPEVVERFRKSVALSSTLDHPNIVRVYDRGGAADEQPYYTMQLVVGGTLAERQRQERFRDPERAARLVIKLARAVHHAHQHGVLHRDISPANVLLDINDEPYLSDFMAKRIGQSGPSSRVGKYAYAAPELAVGDGSTVEADVYGLGATLYELLTGHAPIKAGSFEEVQRQHERGEPKPPRSYVPQIPRDLDAVCYAALSRDPSLRHASAAAFADSLERSLAKFPPLWPKVSRRRRLWLWGCRHPLLAVGALLGALLLLIADWRTLMSVRAEQSELETATLHGNAALASAQARAVLALFEKYANQTARTALDPEVREFLQRGEVTTSAPLLRKIFERTRSFDSAGLFARDGRILARYPDAARGFLGREFRFREYYGCIQALAQRAELVESRRSEPEVCVSSAYRGEISQGIEFTLAAPVYAASGEFIGFVSLNKHAKNTLEEIEIDDAYQSGQTTALFGHRGVDRSSPPRDESLPKKLTAVAHPNLFSAEERALDPELSRKLVLQFGEEGAPGLQLQPVRVRPWEEPDYVDPIIGGRWLAGFAPVGATGFVVSVATPRDKALGASERHIDELWRYALMLNLGFLILAGVALRASLRDVPPGSRS
jgi:eukaryotic-like serine/threonine-protein kinase